MNMFYSSYYIPMWTANATLCSLYPAMHISKTVYWRNFHASKLFIWANHALNLKTLLQKIWGRDICDIMQSPQEKYKWNR